MTKPNSVDAASLHPIVHSPGPWRRDGFAPDIIRSAVIRDATGFEVAHARSWINDQYEANANLVAAAPDLLAACRLVELWMLGGQPGPHSDSIVLEQVKSAIRKATSKVE